MIDLHCHLLPGVDDGSRSVEQSVRVLARMASEGVTGVCLTPHLSASRAEKGIPEAHDAAFDALRAQAPGEVTLSRGVELMMDRPLTPGAAANPLLRLGGTRYLLIEFTRLASATTVANAVAHVVKLGCLPLVAHPERYTGCSVASVTHWRELGALMQVDATTPWRPTGRGARARALLAAGVVDILAADNHGDDRTLGSARARLDTQRAGAEADLLLLRNPAAILADQPVDPVPPVSIRTSILTRVRTLLDEDR